MIDLAVPRRLSPLTLVVGPIQAARAWILPVLIGVIVGFDEGLWMWLFLAAAGLLVGPGVAALRWVRLTWWVEGDRLMVTQGLLNVSARSIPVGRIQSIDLTRPLLPRALGLTGVRVETAGGSGAEVALDYMTVLEAEALKSWLSRRRAVAAAGGEPLTGGEPLIGGEPPATEPSGGEEPAEALVEVDVSRLIVAGATSNRIGALAVGVGAFMSVVDDFGLDVEQLVVDAFPAIGDAGATALVLGIAGIVLLAVVVGWVASVVLTLLRYWGFRLTRAEDEVRAEHGLLSRFEYAVPLHRLQAVRIERSLIRRFFRLGTVIAETAGSPGERQAAQRRLLAPILRLEEMPTVLSEVGISGRVGLDDELDSVHPYARRRGFIRALLPGIPVGGAAVPLLGIGGWVLVGGWIGLAWVWAAARYRALGYSFDGTTVRSRGGVLNLVTWLVPAAKVQTVAVRETPFQRRLGLATVAVDIAGGSGAQILVIDLARPVALDLAARLGEASTVSALADAV